MIKPSESQIILKATLNRCFGSIGDPVDITEWQPVKFGSFLLTKSFLPSNLPLSLANESMIVIHSSCRLWNKTTTQTRLFISSLKADTEAFAGYIRSHCGIQNQLHWCLDVLFCEDKCRICFDHAPRNLSLLGRLALNLLRQEPTGGQFERCWAIVLA
ncbi:MAG: ISAs1 family transposase [Moorea sp. SIO4A3]|nr:ISAs1 family transposase [Moorena sp. SIO4A3]